MSSPRDHPVVSHAEWTAARTQLLDAEKAFTRARDELTRRQRALPWELIETPYVFVGERGEESLADLFAGRSQLVVYHFMFPPEASVGCPICSFWADNFNPVVPHLAQRDVTLIAVSRAPYAKLAAYRARMGWTFTWVSSGDSTFNYDLQASFTEDEVASKRALYNFRVQDPGETDREGVSVFFRSDDGLIHHTYSSYARGIDLLNTAYNYLDLVPKGRDEAGRGPFWVLRHDEYGRPHR